MEERDLIPPIRYPIDDPEFRGFLVSINDQQFGYQGYVVTRNGFDLEIRVVERVPDWLIG